MRTARALALVLAAGLILAPGRARGQFGFGGPRGLGFGGGAGYRGFGFGGLGYGYGFGISPYYYDPALPEPLLYRQAALQGARATMGPVTHDVYQNNPAGYVHHLRDPRYLGGMGAEERRAIEAKIARFSDAPPARARPRRPAPADPPPPAPPAAEVRPTPQAGAVEARGHDARRRVD